MRDSKEGRVKFSSRILLDFSEKLVCKEKQEKRKISYLDFVLGQHLHLNIYLRLFYSNVILI